MVVLVVEGMGVRMVAILTGTVTIKATTLLAMSELETILQPIPTGTTILGLELKSKFARNLFLFELLDQSGGFRLFTSVLLNSERADKTCDIVAVTHTLEAIVTQTETVDMVVPPTVMEGEDHMEEDLVAAPVAIKCPTLELG